MNNLTFTDSEYLNRKRITKREEFLNIMNHIIPWQEWLDFIAPFYYTSGKRGRPPIKLESILRMYLLQCWFNLSDEGVEEAIYDSYALRNFMKIDFYTESVPDATTLLKFRHLLDKNRLAEVLFNAVKKGLAANGCLMQGGTIVDAPIISAPSSTKNQTKSRDPAMASTKKGNQYYFGMKCHAGMDTGSGLVHTIETTSASVHDVAVASKLIREDDTSVYGDSGYLGLEKREEMQAHPACSSLDFRIIQRPSSLEAVISELKIKGFKPKSKFKGKAKDKSKRASSTATPDMRDKALSVWIELERMDIVDNGSDAAFSAYCKKVSKVDHWHWMTDRQAYSIIEGLKVWLARETLKMLITGLAIQDFYYTHDEILYISGATERGVKSLGRMTAAMSNIAISILAQKHGIDNVVTFVNDSLIDTHG